MGSSSLKTDVNALHRLQTQRSCGVLGRDRSICILLGRNAKSCSVADQNANLYKTASIKPTKSSSNADRGAKVGPDELRVAEFVCSRISSALKLGFSLFDGSTTFSQQFRTISVRP